VVSALCVHLAFGTKYRRGVLDTDMLRSCQEATRKICGDFGAELREFTSEDDQVHLLAGYPPKAAVPTLVNSLQGVSARRAPQPVAPDCTRHHDRHPSPA